MSLLNDALKRAKQSSEGDRPPTVPLQPVDYAHRPNPLFQAAVIVLAAVALGFSLWFFWKWWRQRERAARETETELALPKLATTIETPVSSETKPAKPKIRVDTNIVVRTNFVAAPERHPPGDIPILPADASAVQTTNAARTNLARAIERAPSPAVAGDLRLLSIIFREEKPAAVINGDMVRVGEEVRGARVVRIEPHAVTLERSGSNLVLRLPRL